MALLLDSSTPAFAAASTKPWTTASFTPPNNSLIVAVVSADWFNGTPTITVTSTSLTFVSKIKAGAVNQGVTEIFTAEVGSNGGSSRTVSATTSLADQSGGVKVFVFTGQHPTLYVDTTGSNTGDTTNNITPNLLTTGFDGAWVVAGGVDWNDLGAPTSTDVYENFADANLSLIAIRKSTATSPAGVVTGNFDAAGTSAAMWTWAAISIRPDVTAAVDASPMWFPGFMAGNGFPSFMLTALQPVFPAGLSYDVGQASGATQAAPGLASGTGSALDPTRTVATVAGVATATGTANNPTGSTNPVSSAGTGSGAAQTPSPSIQPTGGLASGTGSAFNATVTTGSFTNASAGLATATGTANDPTRSISPTSGGATGVGSANDATGSVAPSPTVAAGVGVANNPTIQTGSFTNASAGVASGTGAAQTPNPKVSPTANIALASATANNAIAGTSVNAGVATATATANAASVTRAASPQAGVATATGTVAAAKIAVLAAAEAAVALAVALTPTAGAFLPGTAHAATGAAATASAAIVTAASASTGAMTVPTATGG